MQDVSQYVEVLDRGKWFLQLPQELRKKLLDMAVLKHYENGEELFARGDKRSGLYAIVSGAFRITGLNADGKEAILTFVETPNWIGEVALFDGDARTHDALSVGESSVLHFPQNALDQLLGENPEYWKEFGLLVAHKLRLAFRAIEDLALLPAPTRLARRLILMAEGYGEVEGDAKLKITVPQEQLGSMLSISRQTTNQILKDLADKSLIRVTYGVIEILNLDGLKSISGE